MKFRKKRGSHARGQEGLALVLTLMVVSIITAMIVEFAYGVYTNSSSLYNWQKSQKLSLAARSATKLAARLIGEYNARPAQAYPGFIEISQAIPFDDPSGTLFLRIEDENAKFNLNTLVSPDGEPDTFAYPEFLRLLQELDLRPEVADIIVDWIDPDNEPRARGSEDGSKNASLDSVDELSMIPGIEREVYDKLVPYVTIYGDGKININTAGIPVLRCLSDSVDKRLAENIVAYREIVPFANNSDIHKVAGVDIGTFKTERLTEKGNAYRVIAAAESEGIRRIIESVLDASGVVKYWKEI